MVPSCCSRSLRAAGGLGLAFAFVTVAAQAQDGTTTRLGQPSGQLNSTFSRLTSVRELADGRVLFTDERENRILIGDFRSGASRPLSRAGAGPGEYTQVGRLWPIAADTTVMADRTARRWLLFHHDSVVGTLGPDHLAARGASGGGRVLDGVAVSGLGLGTTYVIPKGGMMPVNELRLVLFHRQREGSDTLALPAPPRPPRRPQPLPEGVERARGARPGGARTYSIPFDGYDHALLFPDGWLAVARIDPYHVVWCSPTGSCVAGPELDWPVRRVTRPEQIVYLEWLGRTAGWPPTSRPEETADWPVHAPPFIKPPRGYDQSPLVVLADGRLLIWKTPDVASREGRADVIDRQGALAARLAFPLGARVIGASTRWFYVALADEDGEQRLVRYPLPDAVAGSR